MSRLKGLFILEESAFDLVYGEPERAALSRLVDIELRAHSPAGALDDPRLLRDVDVIFSGWGGPVYDGGFLDLAPNLKAIFYGGGAMGGVLTPAVWERGIAVTSAIEANALPVAEYTLATILFSLKHGWPLARQTRQQRFFVERNGAPGCYGSTVGLVSLGVIARTLLKLLQPFDLNVIAYDPFLNAAEAQALGLHGVNLDEVFRQSDVVSLHTPHLPETERLITGKHLASMKPGATFINTARGEVVREDELIEVATRRPDLQFVLDVTDPEPPGVDSPLYELPNVVLTPHIAGSVGQECRRMGRCMVEELERFLAGKPLKWAVTPDSARNTSHRPVLQLNLRTSKLKKPAAAAAAVTTTTTTTTTKPTKSMTPIP
jgi:phosphoglycerate dehydrogenase-like enzyme